jgi:GTP-binding protein
VARRPATPGARKRTKRSPDAPYPYGRRAPAAEETARIAARFLTSAPSLHEAPPETGREVAFAGRSNAGKSSALNRLVGQRALARVSRTPGRTQLLNFFEVAEAGETDARLVDLPGYGYAKADLATRDAWQDQVEGYLAGRQTLVGVVLLMDVRHPFQEFDRLVLDWARASALPLLLLLNKADKLGHGAATEALRDAREAVADVPNARIELFSALRGQGADTVVAVLRDWLALGADAGDA